MALTLAFVNLPQLSVDAGVVTATTKISSAGTTPYTYQWYRSRTAGFTPGSGNLLSGQTNSYLSDVNPPPGGDAYYYACIVTDSASSPATSTVGPASTNVFVPRELGQLGPIDVSRPSAYSNFPNAEDIQDNP
jgi:hypothetical protein